MNSANMYIVCVILAGERQRAGMGRFHADLLG